MLLHVVAARTAAAATLSGHTDFVSFVCISTNFTTIVTAGGGGEDTKVLVL